MPREGILFVLVGPSGAGKNTLMRQVQAQFDNLRQLATMTTRKQRDTEVQGREHWFVSHEEFEALIEQNALVEWQRVHLNDLYGTPRDKVNADLDIAHDLIADIEFLGAGKLQEAYPDNTVLIFVTPSNLDILAERIHQRGAISPEALANRLERARFEMTFAPRCDYLILNDVIDTASEQLRQAIESERLRRRENVTDPDRVIPRHVFHTTVTALIQKGESLLVRHDGHLPTFPLRRHDLLPHENLQNVFRQDFTCEIEIKSVADSRFQFVAPNHVCVSANPPDVYLDYYYKCSTTGTALPVGWKWCPLSALSLPDIVGELVLS